MRRRQHLQLSAGRIAAVDGIPVAREGKGHHTRGGGDSGSSNDGEEGDDYGEQSSSLGGELTDA